MSTNAPDTMQDFESSLRSLASLQKSAILSVLLLIAAVVAIVGSVYYSTTRLAPLEAQIDERKTELAELTAQAALLAERKSELLQATQQSQMELEKTRNALDAAKSTLAGIETRGLSPKARENLSTAISQVASAGTSLSEGESALQASSATPAGPDLGLQETIKGLFASKAAERLKAYDVLMERYASNPEIVPALLAYARENPKNGNGVFNVLVTLSHLQTSQLRPHVEEIKAWAATTGNGARTQERVRKLLSRLPSS